MGGMVASKLKDPTVVAAPFYFASMAAEHLVLRRRAAEEGPGAGDYEKRDTIASLAMGVGSLVAPFATTKLLRPLTPGRGRYGRAVVTGALVAALVTTGADAVTRRRGWGRRKLASAARGVSAAGGVASVVLAATAASTVWHSRLSVERLFAHRLRPAASGWRNLALAVAGWDFIYYWNHRLSHEIRYMWAIHVVHHSSQRYNLSTALRQPVLDAFEPSLPYGVLGLGGISPYQIELARGINLLYQYWIHTEAIRRIGPLETILNSPSHHRVHHGSNRRYIDRNHGSILIIWDRLFATFEPETEDVVYGLTKNIATFNPGRIATHELASILADVAGSDNWRDRAGFVMRGPGWADRRRHQLSRSSETGAALSEPIPVA